MNQEPNGSDLGVNVSSLVQLLFSSVVIACLSFTSMGYTMRHALARVLVLIFGSEKQSYGYRE